MTEQQQGKNLRGQADDDLREDAASDLTAPSDMADKIVGGQKPPADPPLAWGSDISLKTAIRPI